MYTKDVDGYCMVQSSEREKVQFQNSQNISVFQDSGLDDTRDERNAAQLTVTNKTVRYTFDRDKQHKI